ncbi:hypothetical protein C8A00DRAFT_38041 [Chaetomidium leptoderma]|uniref:Protein kinase domain-containing protein n=1 Tax=Chaetomidium leptoderma TaxID=669021 RepID=A0AAN6ZRP8_9PEZI|nr:hypothetical protein C8A00DRAFT_38041 [Chaetomidium leptoderma]
MAPFDDTAVYGHLFSDSADNCPFMERSSAPESLKKHYKISHDFVILKNGRPVDLKTNKDVGGRLRCPVPRNGHNYAVEEADRDELCTRANTMLEQAHDPSNDIGLLERGYPLAVPQLLSAAVTPGGGRVSYWELCNGSTLFSFFRRCIDTGSVLPMGLALHILRQTLETLDFMYTGLESPIYHRDLRASSSYTRVLGQEREIKKLKMWVREEGVEEEEDDEEEEEGV